MQAQVAQARNMSIGEHRHCNVRDCALFMPKQGQVFRVGGGGGKIFKINEKGGVFFLNTSKGG